MTRWETMTSHLRGPSILFAIGTMGVFLRRNLITILLSIEIMLNAVNLTFVAFGRSLGTADGRLPLLISGVVGAVCGVVLIGAAVGSRR